MMLRALLNRRLASMTQPILYKVELRIRICWMGCGQKSAFKAYDITTNFNDLFIILKNVNIHCECEIISIGYVKQIFETGERHKVSSV